MDLRNTRFRGRRPFELSFEVLEYLDLEQLFLLQQIESRKLFHQFPVRPAFTIESFKLVVAREAQHLAYGDMHEILLLLFGEELMPFSEFLYTNQEQHAIEVFRFLTKQPLNFQHKGMPVTIQCQVALKHAAALPNIQKLDAGAG